MTKDEYIVKMKELGWDDTYINEQIEIKEKAKKEGVVIPYEIDLIEAPITN